MSARNRAMPTVPHSCANTPSTTAHVKKSLPSFTGLSTTRPQKYRALASTYQIRRTCLSGRTVSTSIASASSTKGNLLTGGQGRYRVDAAQHFWKGGYHAQKRTCSHARSCGRHIRTRWWASLSLPEALRETVGRRLIHRRLQAPVLRRRQSGT